MISDQITRAESVYGSSVPGGARGDGVPTTRTARPSASANTLAGGVCGRDALLCGWPQWDFKWFGNTRPSNEVAISTVLRQARSQFVGPFCVSTFTSIRASNIRPDNKQRGGAAVSVWRRVVTGGCRCGALVFT
jgi:hypothetical protein